MEDGGNSVFQRLPTARMGMNQNVRKLRTNDILTLEERVREFMALLGIWEQSIYRFIVLNFWATKILVENDDLSACNTVMFHVFYHVVKVLKFLLNNVAEDVVFETKVDTLLDNLLTWSQCSDESNVNIFFWRSYSLQSKMMSSAVS